MERNGRLKQNSQTLRKNQTKEERLLWNAFLKTYPIRFRRQYIIGSYIVDFYCHAAKLAVELDGSQHFIPQNTHYDQIRTAYLESLGVFVLRLSNLDVTRRFQNVCEEIDRIAKIRSDPKP